MTFEPLLATFDPFGRFLSHFLTLSGLYRAILDHFGTKILSFWGDFDHLFLGRTGVILGHIGIVLSSFWGRFGVVLVRVFLERFLESLFRPTRVIFGGFDT